VKRALGIAVAALSLSAAGVLLALVPAGSAQDPPPTTSTTVATTTSTTTSTDTTTSVTTTTTPKPQPQPQPQPQPVNLPQGVTIGGIHVGGLSPDAAYAVVRASVRSPLVLKLGANRVTVPVASLGVVAYAKTAVSRARSSRPGTSVPLGVSVRGGAVRRLVDSLMKRYTRAPIDARVLLRNLRPFITKAEPGTTINRRSAIAAILRAVRENRRTGIDLPYEDVQPAVSRANFGPVIVIRRGSNHLYLYKGMKPWRTFTVATGQAIYPTPLGRFNIVVKWKDPWWYPPDSPWAQGAKPIPPGPGNPLGTRWMGISSPGVGIHGTPDPASLGYSASHGCIRMYIPYAEWLFDHVEVGTPVYIVPA
jgi:lipoprotein-anchoring transpeptidase ErfK/SrfK